MRRKLIRIIKVISKLKLLPNYLTLHFMKFLTQSINLRHKRNQRSHEERSSKAVNFNKIPLNFG